ncbi:hypothetical protein CYMTET_16688 [Cymbomonas tetramitiformis]|uniref:Uncharacterized protein n=1 Tax=Cymbomonas tetramitiformis TaxID=36881 RepID=A0AAE0L7W4_9CHLO|nr:hypothetical protein CYMTET_16688 [Cymbomonas tetramitiformis]
MWNSHWSYVHDRTAPRVIGNMVIFALCVPPSSRFILPRVRKLTPPFSFWPFWLPKYPLEAAAMGALGGIFEDLCARLSWQEALQKGIVEDAPLWSPRALMPALAAFVHPLLAWKCLDGNMKGGDCAMAALNCVPIQLWPFFAVDIQDHNIAERLLYRVWNGTYPPEKMQDFYGRKLRNNDKS